MFSRKNFNLFSFNKSRKKRRSLTILCLDMANNFWQKKKEWKQIYPMPAPMPLEHFRRSSAFNMGVCARVCVHSLENKNFCYKFSFQVISPTSTNLSAIYSINICFINRNKKHTHTHFRIFSCFSMIIRKIFWKTEKNFQMPRFSWQTIIANLITFELNWNIHGKIFVSTFDIHQNLKLKEKKIGKQTIITDL